MSERWSFCSEYIYCEKCAAACKEAALRQARPGGLATLGMVESIICGFGGTLSAAESRVCMEMLRDELDGKICHPVRWVALYDDDTQEFFRIRPKQDCTGWRL
jgi:hypothetical protein